MRYAEGKPTKLPMDVQVHMVAARYGQTPEQIRRWPADDFAHAIAYMAVTRG